MDKRSNPQPHKGMEKREVIVLDFSFVCLMVHRQVTLAEKDKRIEKLKRKWIVFLDDMMHSHY